MKKEEEGNEDYSETGRSGFRTLYKVVWHLKNPKHRLYPCVKKGAPACWPDLFHWRLTRPRDQLFGVLGAGKPKKKDNVVNPISFWDLTEPVKMDRPHSILASEQFVISCPQCEFSPHIILARPP